jgi:superoxide reductase
MADYDNGIKFYRCNVCGNLMFSVVDAGSVPDCDGQPMELLQPQSDGEGADRHLPVIERSGDKVLVRVGAVAHPMLAEHRIEWIALIDGQRIDFQRLSMTGEPLADFTVRDGSEMLKVYAYCNLHGLWEAEVWV